MDLNETLTTMASLLAEGEKKKLIEQIMITIHKKLDEPGILHETQKSDLKNPSKPKRKKKPKKLMHSTKAREIVVRGKKFPSKRSAAEHFKVEYATAIARFKRGLSPDEVFPERNDGP